MIKHTVRRELVVALH